jgi:UDP-2,3-diacylglucosamine pyrophosphatase LpxH
MKGDIEIQTEVASALYVVFNFSQEQEKLNDEMVIDLNTAKFIIFSDQHKGNRNGADDFRICERAYNAALAYYNNLDYTLIVLGDVEELWEERPKDVMKAYSHTMMLEGKFHQNGRYLRIFGNHDDAWRHTDLVEQLLVPALGGGPLKVRESLILHVQDEKDELGVLFLLHGHQGTFGSDRIAVISKWIVRYIWRPIQRFIKISFNTPSRDFKLRHTHDNAMYYWSEAQDKTVLIAGHTHRPVFQSESHEASIRRELENAEKKLAEKPGNENLKKDVANLAAELEWVLAQNQVASTNLKKTDPKKPSYFNTGCCAYLDGDVTGLEICDGEIRLVRWPDDDDNPKPEVLAKAKLRDVLEAC